MDNRRRVFEEFAADYDRWFDDHAKVYQAQLRLMERAVPRQGRTLEIGVGSGRFAAPLGTGYGIDPSLPLARMAKNRGVEIALALGEHLPYRQDSFDAVLMMTVICFLDNLPGVLRECYRVLIPSGRVIIGFIERDGEICRHYRAEAEKGRFLRYARFYSMVDVVSELGSAGFSDVRCIARKHGFGILTGNKPTDSRE